MAFPAETQQSFSRLSETHRSTLMAHCYRMMGSLEDAEDLVQETMIRAWQARDSFAGRASLRTWLYKIATHACLDALDKRKRRSLPTWVVPASDAHTPYVPGVDEAPWLGPFPDRLLETVAPNPEAQFTERESIRLAFMVALHRLPPRQRAVLLLRDVLGWRAKEVAAQLDMTVAAANSALQRARATLQHYDTAAEEIMDSSVANDETTGLVERYLRAWEAADVDRLVGLLTEAAAFSMPPSVIWYRGRAAIRGFLTAVTFEGHAEGRWQMRPTQANTRPALGLYRLDPTTGTYQAAALQVFTVKGDQISEVITFLSETRFTHFGLPLEIGLRKSERQALK